MSEVELDNGVPVDSAEAAPEPAVEAAEPAVEAAPAWAPSPDEWNNLTQSVQQLSQQFQPVEPEPEYFPTDPVTGEQSLTMEGLQKFVQDQIQAGISQYEPVLNQTVAERGEQLINQTFENLAKPADQGGAGLGDFDRALARELAEGYASSGFAPDEAIKRGAQRARDFAQAERQAGIEQYKEEYGTTIKNISQAPHEPGVNGAGVPSEELLPVGHPNRYKQVADNWAARTKLG